jgi:adenine C2-methylase RlmN of 23S rRNA A2503 and tRNA A37
MEVSFVKRYKSINKYHTKNWDTEHTYKYIFRLKDIFIEAGYFIHYKDNNIVKKVIELSSSYGCPFKCKYCASSIINDFEVLSSNILLEVLEYIMNDNKIKKDEEIIVPITGIGDLYFTANEVVKFINECTKKYKNFLFDISTIALNESILNELEKIENISKIRYFQLTFISMNEKAKELVNINFNYNFENIIKIANASNFKKFRINYIMIKNYNDTNEEFEKFMNCIKVINDKVTVRISRINDTISSANNNLLCGSIENMNVLNELLNKNGIKAYTFYSKRNDNMNCGQLIYNIEKEKDI